MTRHHGPPPHEDEWGFALRRGWARHHGPGPFGPMGPPVPWARMFFRGGPRRRHRGVRVGRGDVRAAALALLAEGPLHGYQIIQEISERSRGMWQPSPGSVYPMLQQLEDEGLVVAERAEGRRVFHLTDAGRAYVEEHQEELNAVWAAVTGDVGEDFHDLRDAATGAMSALWQVLQSGTDAQVAEATRVLVATRRQLYQILAGDEPDADDTGVDASGEGPDGPDVRNL
jgi:DNA-binding PadR family transcriptional regulator